MSYIPIKELTGKKDEEIKTNTNIGEGAGESRHYIIKKNQIVFYLVLIVSLYIGFAFVYPFVDKILEGMLAGKIWDFGFIQFDLYLITKIVAIFIILIGSFHTAEEMSRV